MYAPARLSAADAQAIGDHFVHRAADVGLLLLGQLGDQVVADDGLAAPRCLQPLHGLQPQGRLILGERQLFDLRYGGLQRREGVSHLGWAGELNRTHVRILSGQAKR